MTKEPNEKLVTTIDGYVTGFPKDVQKILEQVRATIKKAAPEAEEKISYAIPTFTLNGKNLVHFAAFKNHIGFYPAPTGTEAFKNELSVYKSGKGSVQFPLDHPMPVGLITKIVAFRIKETFEKEKVKKAGKPVSLNKSTDEEQVITWMSKLTPAVKDEIDTVRKIIKSANTKLSERIKWNAPSYYYKQDILTFGPYKQDKILLVFHHPAVVNVKAELLKGEYKDRRLVYFKNGSEAVKNKKELTRIINEIIKILDN